MPARSTYSSLLTTHYVSAASNADAGAFLRWFNTKPGAEFDILLNAEGGSYTPPALTNTLALTAADPLLLWHNTANPAGVPLTWGDLTGTGLTLTPNARGTRFTAPAGSGLTFRATPKTGVWRGAATADAAGKSVKATLGGVFLLDEHGILQPSVGFAWLKATEPALKKAQVRHSFAVVVSE